MVSGLEQGKYKMSSYRASCGVKKLGGGKKGWGLVERTQESK